MQMDSRARLALHQEMIGAGVSEGGEIALRLDDHQMNVEGLSRRAADRLQDDRADGDVRNKRPSITSTWIQSAPAVSTARTSSPKRAKSADRMEGAMMIDGVRRLTRSASSVEALPNVIVRAPVPVLRRPLLDRQTQTTHRPAEPARPVLDCCRRGSR